MRIFVAALILIGICVLAMSIGILAGKGFPKSDVDDNEELRKRGITCFKHEDARLQSEGLAGSRAAGCNGSFSDACKGCSLFKME